MFRWLNRPVGGVENADEVNALDRINRTLQEFLPGSVGPDSKVVGHCEKCGLLIWGHPTQAPLVLSHCEKCS